MGGLLAVGGKSILSLYKVSPTVVDYAGRIFLVVGATLWFRVSNMVLIVGIMRSGGDTRFAFALDVGTVWLVGVPLAFIGAFVLYWPVYYVYLLIMVEEIVKWVIGVARYFSKAWINDLVRTL
jgi:Na+-driven multidrug efflux pump